jgi:hypothetical protein
MIWGFNCKIVYVLQLKYHQKNTTQEQSLVKPKYRRQSKTMMQIPTENSG